MKIDIEKEHTKQNNQTRRIVDQICVCCIKLAKTIEFRCKYSVIYSFPFALFLVRSLHWKKVNLNKNVNCFLSLAPSIEHSTLFTRVKFRAVTIPKNKKIIPWLSKWICIISVKCFEQITNVIVVILNFQVTKRKSCNKRNATTENIQITLKGRNTSAGRCK